MTRRVTSPEVKIAFLEKEIERLGALNAEYNKEIIRLQALVKNNGLEDIKKKVEKLGADHKACLDAFVRGDVKIDMLRVTPTEYATVRKGYLSQRQEREQPNFKQQIIEENSRNLRERERQDSLARSISDKLKRTISNFPERRFPLLKEKPPKKKSS